MAIRFPVRRPETNEVIHPDDLNKNLSEFVDEINGNIDSDNIYLSLEADSFKANSFTECYSKSYTSNSDKYRVSRKTIGWTAEDRNGKKMPIIEFIAPSDGWIIIDFNATFRWKGTGILSSDSYLSKIASHHHYTEYGLTSDMNGVLPPGGWCSIQPFGVGFHDTYEIAGPAFIKAFNDSPGLWMQREYIRDRFGVRFHVEVNGVEISESGWMYNGSYCNGVYLCGSIPVTAGKNIIKSEVRGASLHALKPSKNGIGAEHDKVAGKYTSKYSVTSSETETLLPSFSTKDTFATDGRNSTKVTTQLRTRGIKCHVLSRNLIVQYRAR